MPKIEISKVIKYLEERKSYYERFGVLSAIDNVPKELDNIIKCLEEIK